MIVGIGLNCNAPFTEPELSVNSTSLSQELGKNVGILKIRDSVLGSFANLYELWQAGEDMVPFWTKHLSTLGKNVIIKVKTTETPFSCVAMDVDLDGGLLVETNGETVLVRPEDLEWLREQP